MDRAEFDRHAALEDRHWWFRARREIVLDRLSAYLPPQSGKRILEVGCGTGGNLRLLSSHYDAAGCEPDPYAAGLAVGRAGCPVHCGDALQILRNGTFTPDAVLALDVIEHVEDDAQFLAGIVAAIRPGDLVVVSVPADPRLWSSHDVLLGHYRRYTLASLAASWQGLPVELLWASAFNTLLYPAIVLARNLGRTLRRQQAEHTDLAAVAEPLNTLLYRIFLLERRLLRHRRFAHGASLLAILRKSP